MNVTALLFKSSIGRKYLVALTGLGLFVFVVGHLLGNLQVFLGPEPINHYAEFLQSKQGLLWTVRLGLLLVVTLHIFLTIQLALENRASRPLGYSRSKPPASTLASRTILISGLTIFAFVVYHLLHFTFGTLHPEFLRLEDAQGRHDVYRMMVTGFSNPVVSLFYILSTGLLCLHLSHGISSSFQSLGIRKRTWKFIDRIAKTAAILIFLGNSSIPIAILTGMVK